MKKIALTSLLAVFAASAAGAATINNNPLYRPGAGVGYNVLAIASHSEATNTWGAATEFGYGFTDRLVVKVATDFAEADWFDNAQWGAFGVQADYRVLDDANWKADVYAGYALAPVWGDHTPFLDEDFTSYNWTVGARLGYAADVWTVAGHVEFDYAGSESFNWNDEGAHKIIAGLDAQLVLDANWNLTAGIEYTGYTDDWVKDAGHWTGIFGVNYNLDADKYIGLYISGDVDHSTGDWDFEDGFGFGAKFGVQF